MMILLQSRRRRRRQQQPRGSPGFKRIRKRSLESTHLFLLFALLCCSTSVLIAAAADDNADGGKKRMMMMGFGRVIDWVVGATMAGGVKNNNKKNSVQKEDLEKMVVAPKQAEPEVNAAATSLSSAGDVEQQKSEEQQVVIDDKEEVEEAEAGSTSGEDESPPEQVDEEEVVASSTPRAPEPPAADSLPPQKEEEEEEEATQSTPEAAAPTATADEEPALLQIDTADNLGEPQHVDDVDHRDATIEVIANAQRYMKEVVMVEEKYATVRGDCLNRHALCALWAAIGECESNERFMTINCAPVCRSCEELHVSKRCPLLVPLAVNAWNTVDEMNDMFERLTTDPYLVQRYNPLVLARPTLAPGDTAETAKYRLGMWLVQLDDFVNVNGAARVIEVAKKLPQKRSEEVTVDNPDGTFAQGIIDGRTSTSAWCVEKCAESNVGQALNNRLTNITGINAERNAEPWELVQYLPTQSYDVHNDFKQYWNARPAGPRIVSIIVNLVTVPDGSGGTYFPHLGLTVPAKRGRAIVWNTVSGANLNQATSPLADHAELSVSKEAATTVQYSAQTWLHMRDFAAPYKAGC